MIKELKPSNFLGKWSWELSATCLFSPCFIIFKAEPQTCSVVERVVGGWWVTKLAQCLLPNSNV